MAKIAGWTELRNALDPTRLIVMLAAGAEIENKKVVNSSDMEVIFMICFGLV